MGGRTGKFVAAFAVACAMVSSSVSVVDAGAASRAASKAPITLA